MRIEVIIPGILRDSVGGRTKFAIEADTLAEALQVIQKDYPILRVHIWDDFGNLRQHVLIFHNDTSTRWIKDQSLPLKEGDRLQVVQAISGGSK